MSLSQYACHKHVNNNYYYVPFTLMPHLIIRDITGSLYFRDTSPLFGPRPCPWPQVSAVTSNLYLPALAPNLFLPTLTHKFLFTGPGHQLLFNDHGSQFVFTSPGSKFVFTGPASKFVFTGPGSKFVFTGPGSMYLPALFLFLKALLQIQISHIF